MDGEELNDAQLVGRCCRAIGDEMEEFYLRRRALREYLYHVDSVGRMCWTTVKILAFIWHFYRSAGCNAEQEMKRNDPML